MGVGVLYSTEFNMKCREITLMPNSAVAAATAHVRSSSGRAGPLDRADSSCRAGSFACLEARDPSAGGAVTNPSHELEAGTGRSRLGPRTPSAAGVGLVETVGQDLAVQTCGRGGGRMPGRRHGRAPTKARRQCCTRATGRERL